MSSSDPTRPGQGPSPFFVKCMAAMLAAFGIVYVVFGPHNEAVIDTGGSSSTDRILAAADKEALRINGPTPSGMVAIGHTARAKGHTWLCPQRHQVSQLLAKVKANGSFADLAALSTKLSCITVDGDPYLNVENISQSDGLECVTVPGEDNGPDGCLWTPAFSIEDRGD